MAIYTKTGDQGQTSLLGGERVTKDCINLQVVGALDELNAVLGIVVLKMTSGDLANMVQSVQKKLFQLGAEVAGLQSGVPTTSNNMLAAGDIDELEKSIDKLWSDLPELQKFILPGGSEAGAFLHLARTICRRAERELVHLGQTKKVRDELYMYLNRLSDWLFTAARWVNYQRGEEEVKV